MSSNGNGRLEVSASEDEHDRRLEAMTNLMCGNVRDFMEDFK